MNANRVIRNVLGVIALVTAGYLGGKYIYTPQRAWNADTNRDGIEDLVVEARNKKRTIVYGISDSTEKLKEFVSGDEANEIFNARWREGYVEYWKEKPDYDKFHLKSGWKHW